MSKTKSNFTNINNKYMPMTTKNKTEKNNDDNTNNKSFKSIAKNNI